MIAKNCIRCGQIFNTENDRRMYCSTKCSKAAQKKRSRAMKTYARECVECGNGFVSPTPKGKYCSDKCRRRHNNHRHEIDRRHKIKENGRIDWSISLGKLAKRDNNECYICKNKVDMKASGNHDNYGSIDHVIPISKGGTHTWDNVMLAHRRCNMMKRNDLIYSKPSGQLMMAL